MVLMGYIKGKKQEKKERKKLSTSNLLNLMILFGIYRDNNHCVSTCGCFTKASIMIASLNCPLRLCAAFKKFSNSANISFWLSTIQRNLHRATAFFKLILYISICHSLCTTLKAIPVSSTAVSWQHGADLNVLAIQLLTSLHLSRQCGRVGSTGWSDEDTL